MNIPLFKDMSVETPTYEDLAEKYKAIEAALTGADSAAAQIEAMNKWNDLRKTYFTWGSLVHLHYRQDTQNESYRKQREYCDELSSRVVKFSIAMKEKLLASPFRKDLEKSFGRHVFDLWEIDSKTFAPVIEEDLQAESKLCAEYTALVASAEFQFQGKTLNMPALAKYFQDQDRQTRHDAQKLSAALFHERHGEFDRIYHELTQLRDGMAKKLRYDNFVTLGYYRMSRIGFDQASVAAFRQEVQDRVVPLCVDLKKKQAKRLGLPKVMAWDEPVYDEKPNPAPKGDYPWMIKQAQTMFDELGHGFSPFFAMMREHGLLDLKARTGKASGGFCTAFARWGTPFIFANFNGTKSDVDVFTHEMGHAFQFWSARDKDVLEYRHPSMEGCEVHSMSLEFLCWPHMALFFGEDAERYRQSHLAGQIMFLPYGVAVDHFQHLVYENPAATPQERRDMWKQMEARYLPWRDYGDLPYVSEGGRWQGQSHIFGSPFYYIDYVLAATCALQFWGRAEEDRGRAMADYVALCERGGEAPFEDLVRGAGLKSPFEAGCLKAVVDRACAELL